MSIDPTPAAAGGPIERPHSFQSEALGLPHGFFGRHGGVSTGVYASLNAGLGSRDDARAVTENRRRIAAALCVTPERLIGVHQVHSAKAVRANGPWAAGRPEADG